jgi:hypothetical protein
MESYWVDTTGSGWNPRLAMVVVKEEGEEAGGEQC